MKKLALVLSTPVLAVLILTCGAHAEEGPTAEAEAQVQAAVPSELGQLAEQINSSIRASKSLEKYGFTVTEEEQISAHIGLWDALFLPVYIVNNIGGQDYQTVNFKVRVGDQDGKLICQAVNYRENRMVSVYACRSHGLKSYPEGVRVERPFGMMFGHTSEIASFKY